MLLMAVPITSKKNKVKKLQEAVNKLKQDFLELQDQNEELKNNVSTLNTDFLDLQAENEELKNNSIAFNNDLSVNAEKIEVLENNQGKYFSVYGGFHAVAKIIRELKSHMFPYKFKCSHWWKIALQSECCNFNQ